MKIEAYPATAYLDLPLAAKLKAKGNWLGVLGRYEKKFSAWKKLYLSFWWETNFGEWYVG